MDLTLILASKLTLVSSQLYLWKIDLTLCIRILDPRIVVGIELIWKYFQLLSYIARHCCGEWIYTTGEDFEHFCRFLYSRLTDVFLWLSLAWNVYKVFSLFDTLQTTKTTFSFRKANISSSQIVRFTSQHFNLLVFLHFL